MREEGDKTKPSLFTQIYSSSDHKTLLQDPV